MPRKFFKRYSPDPKRIRDTPGLGFLGERLHQPNLWHFNRHSISKAFAIGLFCMWIPFPFQTLIAAACALLFRANLPLSVALVFITNPVTIPPMFYFAYKLGNLVLSLPTGEFSMELSMHWLTQRMGEIWQPLFTGCFLLALFSSMLGFFTIQALWRYNIHTKLKHRANRPCNDLNKSDTE